MAHPEYPEWLRPEWSVKNPLYARPTTDPSLDWDHLTHPSGLDDSGLLTPSLTHTFTLGGLAHRRDGPAQVWVGMEYRFYMNNSLHRVDGPARNYRDRRLEFWVNGRRHRMDGPAVMISGYAPEWWVNGIRLPDNPTDLDILGALL